MSRLIGRHLRIDGAVRCRRSAAPLDTLIVAGGRGVEAAAAQDADRIGSIRAPDPRDGGPPRRLGLHRERYLLASNGSAGRPARGDPLVRSAPNLARTVSDPCGSRPIRSS